MQRLEVFEGEAKKRFMLHYNFPPFSVGEVAFLRGADVARLVTAHWPSGRFRPFCQRRKVALCDARGL